MVTIEILPQNLTFHIYEAMDKMRLSQYCGTSSPICVLFIVLIPKPSISKRKWLCIMFIVSFQLTLHQGIVYITFIACVATQYLILLHSILFSLLSQSFLCPFYPFLIKTSLISPDSWESRTYQEYFI